MKATISVCFAAAVLVAATATAQTAKPAAQAPQPAPAPKPATAVPAAPRTLSASVVAFPHIHLQVKDVAAAKKFWVDTLGGTAVTAGVTIGEAVRFPNVLIFLEPGDSKGGSKGTIVDHVAFDVKDVKAVVAKLKEAKATLVTRAETNPVYVVTDDVAFMPDQATSSAVVMAPGDMKVELWETKTLATPNAFRHIHFAPAAIGPIKDWYIANLGARLGTRGFGFEGLDLAGKPNVLMFTLASEKVVGTEGRVNNRIGFEVRGLALLAKKLEKAGAKVTRPYGKSAQGPGMSVVLTDPFGTSIELTEGMAKLQ